MTETLIFDQRDYTLVKNRAPKSRKQIVRTSISKLVKAANTTTTNCVEKILKFTSWMAGSQTVFRSRMVGHVPIL